MEVGPVASNFFTAVALRPASVFSLEGGRLAATPRPTGGELCLQQRWISASQSYFQVKGRFMPVARVSVAADPAYTVPTGSSAPGVSG